MLLGRRFVLTALATLVARLDKDITRAEDWAREFGVEALHRNREALWRRCS